MIVREESFAIEAFDGASIPVHRWQKEFGARAVVVISHGLSEHALRYRPVAVLLAENDYSVYSNDHRGHGFAVTRPQMLGEFGDGGFAALVEDLKQVVWLAATEHPGAPIFLVGHSMGSYVAQRYILNNSANLAGVALTGGSAMDLRYRGVVSDGLMKTTIGDGGSYSTAAEFDWLSRDRAVVASYLDDPLCGLTPSSTTRRHILAAAPQLRNSDQLRHIRKDLPIYMFTGEMDPENGFGRYFEVLLERYQSVGMRDISAHVYQGARHETLNELNRAEVVKNLVNWINANCSAPDSRRSGMSPLVHAPRYRRMPLRGLYG